VKEDRVYLTHVLECIGYIREDTAGGADSFFHDRTKRDAVLRNLQIMAESTQRISVAAKAAHPEIDWTGIAGFRNVVAHDYLGINLNRVWFIVEELLPDLETKVPAILASLAES
jgi:uncharacterized protein with HEPN domain